MRIRAILFSAAVAASAVAGIGASGASAATLWTTTAHTTRVAVGATGDAINSGPIVLTSNGSAINSCSASTLHLVVDENTDTRVSITVTAGTVTGCTNFPVTPTFSPSWKVTVTGASSVVGANTVFASTVHNVAFDLVGVGLFSGNLETGVTATQVTAGTAPICLTLTSAAGLSGPAPGTIDGRYCFEGASAAWSATT
jgi:hypothetical protein